MRVTNKKQWLHYHDSKICYQLHKAPSSGDKPYIIFVHGFLSTQYSFRKLIPHLVPAFHVVTLDLPPFGDSERCVEFKYSYSNMAKLLLHFMNTFSIQKAYVSGHSMGGQIALTFAHLYPERVEKLFLMAPSSYMKKADFLTGLSSSLPFFPSLLKRVFRQNGVYGILQKCIYNEQIINKRMLAIYSKPFLDDDIYKCLTKMVRDREGDLKEPDLQTISKKTVVFWGKEDQILPHTIGYQLLKDLPSAELCLFSHTGHFLPEERPLPIAQYILHIKDN
ncbi:alpha/beta fold hydrolase [Sediminibacillus massiliensis]|uniref:alpha/beta fold hydrolase n=1 Tax=Sediminibacillus massiliensis TaxID=1926277 RepID=UPI0009886F6D|nr:alpha/beta hydrolase [Sediminibacillus massiliensis]